MNKCYNCLFAKKIRRQLRQDQTECEKIIWSNLRNRRFNNLKFYRQYSVGRYVLDFYCPAARLAVEIDGGQHNNVSQTIKDTQRTKYLFRREITVVRFWNNEVRDNLQGVLEKLDQVVGSGSSPLRGRG